MINKFAPRFAILCYLLIGLSVCVGGCGAMGWMASWFPPDAIEALYEFPEDSTVLVLVDDPQGLGRNATIQHQLTSELNDQLRKHKIGEKIIAQKKLLIEMSRTPSFHQLSITEIGKRLGADVVLHVKIDEFGLKDNSLSPIWHGQLGAVVKVVSVADGRLWPTDRHTGYIMPKINAPRESDDGSKRMGAKITSRMAKEMADRIAKLFYKHPGKAHEELPDEQPI